MNFTLCTDDKAFPYMIVDDFYSIEEQDLIWEELEYYRKENLIDEMIFILMENFQVVMVLVQQQT